MYRLLHKRGYEDDQIHYMSVLPPDIEKPLGHPEPERQDYNLFDPKQQLSEAFTQATTMLKAGNQFVFYLYGHAVPDKVSIGNYILTTIQLRDLLATILTEVEQIIILDTCFSGSFMDDLAGVEKRIFICANFEVY